MLVVPVGVKNKESIMIDIFEIAKRIPIERAEPLLTISVSVNESNGICSLQGLCHDLLPNFESWTEQDDKNKSTLAEYLRGVADAIEQGKQG